VANVVVVGAQWGDEGKGKITDWLASQARWVVRYQGGANAGHTVIVDGETYKLHLVPSGILYPEVACVIGSGTVIDPARLLDELTMLKNKGIDLGRLHLSSGAHLTMPYHRIIDESEERRRGGSALGTTGRGIGPTYTDKANRSGLRVGDLRDPMGFKTRLEDIMETKNLILTRIYDCAPLDVNQVYDQYMAYADALTPYIKDTVSLLHGAITRDEPILFEGAQGTLLDIDFGSYPFVTSSHPIAGGACIGAGVGPNAIDRVLGVVKAYTTRVGAGPFPTELSDETGEQLRRNGQEFGTTTGRARRCGWFDAVVGRLATRLNGLDSIAVTKLDVLDGFESLRICVGYRIDGRVLDEFPATLTELAQAEPIYEEIPGWQASTRHCRHYDELPIQAQRYLERLAALVGAPLAMVAVGPERDQTIILERLLDGPRRQLQAV